MTTADLTGLLVEDRWLRDLLRGLLQEQDSADVAQDTWLRALRRPAGAAVPGRGWLAVVARHLAWRSIRTRQRVARREAAVARAEAQPAAAETVARLELQQHVARAVLGLGEPFRTAVLLRYYEGMTPAAIAARLGIPAATVRTRVLRGLLLLRQELDRDGSRDWRATALCFAVPRAGTALLPGAFLLSGKLLLGLAGCGLIALLVGLWPLSALPETGLPQPLAPLSGRAGQRDVGPQRVASQPGAETGHREAVAPAVAATDRDQASRPVRMRLGGRVSDTSGRGLANVLLGIHVTDGPPPGGSASDPNPELRFTVLPDGSRVDYLGRSGADGSFAFELAAVTGRIWALGEHATVRGCSVQHDHPESTGLLVVAARAVEVAGLAVDEHDQPLADVRVQVKEGLLARFPEALDRTFAREFAPATTDARGEFVLGTLPAAPELTVEATRAGFDDIRAPVPDGSTGALRLVMKSRQRDLVTVRGEVRERGGMLLPDATVACGCLRTVTDARGRFELLLERVNPEDALAAAHVGHQPALLPRFGAELESWRGKVREITLTLGPATLSIHGKVLGPDGKPGAGMRILLVDPTWAGDGLSMEHIGAGQEGTAMDEPAVASTAADGSFEIHGLGARDYRLRVVHMLSVLALVSDPIPAGSRDVVLRFPADAVRSRVTGRVVRRDGAPAVGVSVGPCLTILQNDTGSISISGNGAQWGKTDGEGRFELRGVPRREVFLTVGGEDVAAGMLRLPPEHPDDGVEIRIATRCHFRIEPGARGAVPDLVEFLDAAGRNVPVTRLQEGGSFANARSTLTDGQSPVLSVSDAAETVVFHRSGSELLRRSVVLRAGEVTVIRP